jgi:hypothetical protein
LTMSLSPSAQPGQVETLFVEGKTSPGLGAGHSQGAL